MTPGRWRRVRAGRLRTAGLRRSTLGAHRRVGVLVVLSLVVTACNASAATRPDRTAGEGAAPADGIEAMTQTVAGTDQGHFSDPYPVHRAPAAGATPQAFSGTTKAVLSCAGPIERACFSARPLTVAPGPSLVAEAKAAGARIVGSCNENVYQQDSGTWTMATTLTVERTADTRDRWHVVAAARPTRTSGSAVPTAWTADAVLVGSFARPARADYDGKYYENAGHLYLVYSAQLSARPHEDGIVAQLLESPTRVAATPATTLLGPTTTDGGFNSENYEGVDQPGFKLLETGNITEIDGRYALAYSTGAYDRPDYKIGVAWSDTFLPAKGQQYEKVLRQDTTGVWGRPGHPEVRYLLQSQERDWPDYVAGTVLAPGVPSIVEDAGHWYLYFAGYPPTDTTGPAGTFDGRDRHPYFMALRVDIPAGATVAGTSGYGLDGWVVPAQ